MTGGHDKGAAYAVQAYAAWVPRIIVKGAEWLAYALVIFLVIVLSMQVLFRYALQLPLSWSEEAARFALVWLSMAAGTMAAYHGEHFVFRWVTNFLPANVQFWLRRVVEVAVVAALVLILLKSWDYLGLVAGRTASGTGINMRIPYAAVTAGIGAMIVVYSFDFFDALMSRVTGITLSPREKAEADIARLFRMGRDAEAERPL
jgi:TRAP-type C4-dicarboxylate transport system permease small subunit